MLNIYKLGGDITVDPKRIELAKNLIEKEESKKILVVSAMRGVTDSLLNTNDETFNELLEKHLELGKSLKIFPEKIEGKIREELENLKNENPHEVVSLGERLMTIILKEYFDSQGILVEKTTGYDLGVVVEDEIISKDCAEEVKERLRNNFLDKNITPLVTGFDGIFRGERKTIGRSGSDQTATFLAFATDADSVYLFKNTKGVQTADPSIVENTKNIQTLSYDMAMEAGNIQFEAVRFVKEKEISLIIQYIENSEIKTIINGDFKSDGIELVTGIEDCAFFEVNEIRDTPGAEKEITDLFAKHGINKEISLDTRNSVAFVVNTGLEKLEEVAKELKRKGHKILIRKCSLIIVIGILHRENKQKFEDCVWEICEPFSSASWINKSIVSSVIVPKEKYREVLRHLHKKLVEKN